MIQKNLTTIVAANHLMADTIAKAICHTNISTTQIYARITNDKISKDMNNLSKNLGALDF